MGESIKERRARTRKAGKCQMCEASVSLKDQYTVTNDLDKGAVVLRRDAARKGAEAASHYCGECAERRVKQKQAWLSSRAKRMAKESA